MRRPHPHPLLFNSLTPLVPVSQAPRNTRLCCWVARRLLFHIAVLGDAVVRSHGDLVQGCVCWGAVHPALSPRSHSLFWGPSRAAGGREKEDPQLIHHGRSLCPGCSGPVRCGVLPRIPGAAWGSGRRAGEQGVEAEGRVDRDRGGAAAWCGRLSGAPGHESSARARLADPGAGRSCEPGRAERAAGGASERWEARERAAGSVSAGICAAASARSPGTERRTRRLAHGREAPALCSVPVRRGFPTVAATASRRPRRPAAGGAGAARSARLSPACPAARRAAPSRGAPGLQTRAGGESVFMNPEDVREALQGS